MTHTFSSKELSYEARIFEQHATPKQNRIPSRDRIVPDFRTTHLNFKAAKIFIDKRVLTLNKKSRLYLMYVLMKNLVNGFYDGSA